MKDALGDAQSVLVLGGGSEIGQAIVRALVARKCTRVVLGARQPEALDAFRFEMEGKGAAVTTFVFDADDTANHDTAIGQALSHGDIDIVVLAFAVLGDQGAFDADPQLAAAAAHTNYVGSVSAGLISAARLRAQGHGTIVVLSSVAGERVRAANFVYGSTKAGLDAFAQGLDDSLVGSGVRVLVVRPGFVTTKMTEGMKPAPFSTTADAVAAATVKGLASGARTVWVPAILRPVFAGMRHLPRGLWRKLPG